MNPDHPFEEKLAIDDVSLTEDIESEPKFDLAQTKDKKLDKLREITRTTKHRPLTLLSKTLLALNGWIFISWVSILGQFSQVVIFNFHERAPEALWIYLQWMWLFLLKSFLEASAHGIWWFFDTNNYQLSQHLFLLGCLFSLMILPFYAFHILRNGSLSPLAKLVWSVFVFGSTFIGFPAGLLFYWNEHLRLYKD